jgi:ERCC4-type nuclease
LAGFTDRVAIERKSLSDLVMCVGPERERFLDEMRRLRAYDVRAVVVEASVDAVLAHAYRSNTAPQSVIGTTVSIWVDHGVPTIWGGDAKNAANLVERMFARIAAKGIPWAA